MYLRVDMRVDVHAGMRAGMHVAVDYIRLGARLMSHSTKALRTLVHAHGPSIQTRFGRVVTVAGLSALGL